MDPFLYRRPDSAFWWMRWQDPANPKKKLSKSTGRADEAEANEVLAVLRRQLAAMRRHEAMAPLTVDGYREKWIARREKSDVSSVRDDKGRFAHFSRDFIAKPLDQVEREDVRLEIRRLIDGGELAPRTVRKVYEALRVMYTDAKLEGLVKETPCTLKTRRKELPPVEDADPEWRDEAFITAPEVERLISSSAVPLYRRTIYALGFLGAMRVSEFAARRFSDIRQATPLHEMRIATSWDRKEQALGPTKTGKKRRMPIHPALADVLTEWKAHGWAEVFGRPPTAEDLLVPSLRGPDFHLCSNTSLKYLHKDLEALGLRRIRQHDGRATFITLALSHGAAKDQLRWATHGPTNKEGIDMYARPIWEIVCAQVLKVPVTYGGLRQVTETKKASVSADLWMPRAGFEPAPVDISGPLGESQRPESVGISRGRRLSRGMDESAHRNQAVTPSLGFAQDAWGGFYLRRGGGVA